MMGAREDFIHYVRHGGDGPFVSLQIGAGAGFDTKLAGKEWVSETTLDDTIAAYEKVGGHPFFNVGLPGFGGVVPELAWQTAQESRHDVRLSRTWLDTPYGTLSFEFQEKPRGGTTPTKYPLVFGDSLDVVKWYAEQFAKGIPYAGDLVGPTCEKLRPYGAVDVQWNVQPFEIFGLATALDQVMMLTVDPDGYRAVCDAVLEVNRRLVREVVRGGADFVFVGGPGKELASPLVYERFLVPDSREIANTAHEEGGLVYSHICSPIEPFLSMGCYAQMGFDLFETLSPPPVGNVECLAEARRHLPDTMCTRGNIGLDVLLTGTVQDVERETLRVIESTRGAKHMVAASDYLFFDVPLENVQAVVRTTLQSG